MRRRILRMGDEINFDVEGRVILPKLERELRLKKELEKEKFKENEEIVDCWQSLSFDAGNFFSNMNFVGGITGRRNRYYLYSKDNFLMLSSGFNDEKPTRANIFLIEEMEFLKSFIKKKYKESRLIGAPINFVMDYLKQNYESIPNHLIRLKIIVLLNIQKVDEKNYLYNFILSSFYILSILENDFNLSTDRKKFTLRIESNISKDKLNNIYLDCKIKNYDNKRIVFERDNFYFVISFNKPFRGICYIYDEREINYLKEILNNPLFFYEDIWKERIEINCLKILEFINQEQNNICLVCYREIMAKNQRNKREVMEYTNSRLKLALRIINLINNNLLIEKDGRKYRYFKRKD